MSARQRGEHHRHRPLGRARPIARIALAGLVGVVVLAACGDDDGEAERYTDELRERFVGDCTSAGESEAVCGCFYDALAANVPIERFRELDEQIQDGTAQVPDDIVDLAVACGADPTFATP